MFDSVMNFFNNNYIIILISVLLILASISIYYFRNSKNSTSSPNTPPNDLEGIDNVNMVCDLATGECSTHTFVHENIEPTNENTQV